MSLDPSSFGPLPPSDARVSGVERDQSGPIAPWRLMLICEIVNFAALRRLLGCATVDTLIEAVGAEIRYLMPLAHVAATGRATLEILFAGALPGDADIAIERVGAHFAAPLQLEGVGHSVELLIAGAAIPSHECDEVRFVEGAEDALVRARRERRPVVCDLSRAESSYDDLALMRDLNDAIRDGDVFLQYQPKVHLRRQEVVSVEALVRWHHPQRGLILPGDFIPLAEQCGKIDSLTLWTIRKAMSDQLVLAAAGHDVPIFVNISGMLLADADFVERACAIIKGNPARIGFEITETAVIRDPEGAIRHLRMFDAIGVTLAIDDYGAGLSSLAYLKQLPARELKIDKMFILDLTSSNRDPLIVRSTIDLAHALDMQVTAEGVETPAALALLGVMGCDLAQGYLISRPIPIHALMQFLDEGRHLSATAATRPSFGRPESFWKRA